MPTPAQQVSIDQRRAAYAWEKVHEHKKILAKYTNLAKAAPALVMSNGLMQTLAFFAAKGEEHHKALNADIIGWLTRRDGPLKGGSTDFKSAMDQLLHADGPTYLRKTEETFALLRWIRQFAAAAEKTGGA